MELLEHHIRDDMNRRSARTMVVLRPVKVVITNLPEGHMEQLEALVRPDVKENEKYGTYKVRNWTASTRAEKFVFDSQLMVVDLFQGCISSRGIFRVV
jgi:hypothetical protein